MPPYLTVMNMVIWMRNSKILHSLCNQIDLGYKTLKQPHSKCLLSFRTVAYVLVRRLMLNEKPATYIISFDTENDIQTTCK